MTNFVKGNITEGTITDLKTTMQWLQSNYPSNLKLHADGSDLRVTFSFTVVDLDAGISAIQAILIEHPSAIWTADLE